MRQLTRDEAIAFKVPESWTPDQVFLFQVHQECLCMQFADFQKATEEALGRPVWTHEFAKPENLIREYEERKPAPSMDQIVAMLPAEKTIVIKQGEP